MGGLKSMVFPDEPRPLAARRFLKIVFRAVHVLFAGVYLGAFVFAATADARCAWGIGLAISGVLLLLLDLHESGAFLLQVRGLLVMIKIALLICLPLLHPHEACVLGSVVIVSVISSHAPSSVRYRVLFGGGKIKGASSSG